MKIGIIGSGKIGTLVGCRWVEAGHEVKFSSRHPESLATLAQELGARASVGTPEEAARFGEVLLISVLYNALPELGNTLGPSLAGKVVLETGNTYPGRDGKMAQEVIDSGLGTGVWSSRFLPGTRLVRAFNTLSYMIFAHEANRPAPRLAVPIAGDDPEAVQVAAGLVRDAGFDAVEVGKLADARRFQRGAPGYGQNVAAAELKQKLSLAP